MIYSEPGVSFASGTETDTWNESESKISCFCLCLYETHSYASSKTGAGVSWRGEYFGSLVWFSITNTQINVDTIGLHRYNTEAFAVVYIGGWGSIGLKCILDHTAALYRGITVGHQRLASIISHIFNNKKYCYCNYCHFSLLNHFKLILKYWN